MFDMRTSKKKSGFTLIELIITIAIVAILSAILLVNINSYIENAKYASDITNLRTLNNITLYYRVSLEESDPFTDESNSSSELMNVLVDNDLLSNPVQTQTKDTSFLWSFDSMAWYFIEGDVFYTLKYSDGFTMTNYGRLLGPYTGTEKDVLLLSEMNGVLIKELYQNIFRDKELTSFVFQTPSAVIQIHAHAFRNNELTTIIFPETLQKIDVSSFENNNLTEITLPESVTSVQWKAFANNNITKITVGSQLTTIGNYAFQNNHAGFVTAYQAGGAGTYIFTNGVWVKQ